MAGQQVPLNIIVHGTGSDFDHANRAGRRLRIRSRRCKKRHPRPGHNVSGSLGASTPSDALSNLILEPHSARISEEVFAQFVGKVIARLNLEFNVFQINGYLIKTLVALYPTALYVLTIRDCASWLRSFVNHQTKRPVGQGRFWHASGSCGSSQTNTPIGLRRGAGGARPLQSGRISLLLAVAQFRILQGCSAVLLLSSRPPGWPRNLEMICGVPEHQVRRSGTYAVDRVRGAMWVARSTGWTPIMFVCGQPPAQAR